MPILILIFSLFFNQSLEASSTSLNYRGYSARALGMGNAFSSVVDDSSALYYNPAALSQLNGVRFTLMDPYIGINDLTHLEDTLKSADSSSNPNQFVTLIRDLYGENIWLGAGAKAGFAMTNFAIYYYDQAELSGVLNNPAYPTFDVTYKNDIGFHLGFSLELGNQLYAGLGIRSISRTGGQIPVSVEILEDLDADTVENSLLREGTGVGVDLGFLYKADTALSPSFAFTWMNVGDTKFKKETELAPTKEKSYMSLGVSLTFDLPLITIIPAIDYKFLDRNDIEFGKKLDLGLEIDFPLLTVRGGFHQGYYTAGFSVDLFILRLDAATYAEELGAYPGQAEDRRYMVQLAMELGVDADFNFYKLDSKARRKLKKRR